MLDVVNKALLGANLSKKEGPKSFSVKECNEYILRSDKQFKGEVLIEKLV